MKIHFPTPIPRQSPQWPGYVMRGYDVVEADLREAPVAIRQTFGESLIFEWRLWNGHLWVEAENPAFARAQQRRSGHRVNLENSIGHPMAVRNHLIDMALDLQTAVFHGGERKHPTKPEPFYLAAISERARNLLLLDGQFWRRSTGPLITISRPYRTLYWDTQSGPPTERAILEFADPDIDDLAARLSEFYALDFRIQGQRPIVVGPTPPVAAYQGGDGHALLAAIHIAFGWAARTPAEQGTREQIRAFERLRARLERSWSPELVGMLASDNMLPDASRTGKTSLQDFSSFDPPIEPGDVELLGDFLAAFPDAATPKPLRLIELGQWRGRGLFPQPAPPQADADALSI